MTWHLVGLPHAHLRPEVTVCAFTQKARKFLKMMEGHDIVYYGGEESQVPDSCEFVPIYSDEEQRSWYGDYDPNTLPIVAGSWSADQKAYKVTNHRAIGEINARWERGDFVLISAGLAQKPIVEQMPKGRNGRPCAEWAAGYSGVFFSDRSFEFPPYVCFESHAWRHFLYGKYGIEDGRWFDTVIPNFFDPKEWTLWEKEDYLVFVGRLINRKGPHIAAEIARELGMPLYVAGSGMREHHKKLIICQDGTKLEGDVHYMGCVGAAERDELMGKARCLMAPTTYIEPFGAVVVESMLCGTPSVATDWGSFSELLPPERRFRTLSEGVDAVKAAMELPPAVIQKEALKRWSLKAVRPMYERWMRELQTLWEDGWYSQTSISTRPSPTLEGSSEAATTPLTIPISGAGS
jgi:glycosyltransferase involved in cell wall biosynthesis